MAVLAVGNLGPMAGQLSTSSITPRASTPIRISVTPMNTTAVSACWSGGRSRDYIVDEYSIADMISWLGADRKPLGQALDEFPNVARWRRVRDRPAVKRCRSRQGVRRQAPPSDKDARSCSTRPPAPCSAVDLRQ